MNEIQKQGAFFAEAFEGYEVPEQLKTAASRICTAYGIRGICDPMYIANVIAVELHIGDGQSHFDTTTPELLPACADLLNACDKQMADRDQGVNGEVLSAMEQARVVLARQEESDE